ncbi:MAG TPA: hypothetical protein VK997_03770 [Deferrisomatales bacterium]|nr:hypothetical protein [Deferrisomatales bacterium]
MNKIIYCIMIPFLWGATISIAGDLEDLPETEEGFKIKIEAFIRPGDSLADAQHLLDAHRFECKALEDESHGMWCTRSDRQSLSSISRRYQVVLTTKGKTVTAMKTSTGLVGP